MRVHLLTFSLLLVLILHLMSVTYTQTCDSQTCSCQQNCTTGEYFNNQTNSCVTCPTGHFCPAGTHYAMACPAGSYNPYTGKSSSSDCLSCQSGYYNTLLGQETCTICPLGFFCSHSTATPVACDPGTYTPSTGQISCSQCPAGKYCPTTTGTPQDCPTGTFNPSNGAVSSCQTCSDGEYTPTSGSTSCTQCPGGFFCVAGSRTACPVPRYSLPGASTCLPCPAGFSCVDSAANPVICPNGTASAANERDCTTCASGTYAASQGKTTCDPCGPGRSCEDPAQLPVLCVAGTFSPSYSSFCEACPSGTYSSEGDSYCRSCLPGYACPSPASVPISCTPGYYSISNQTFCTRCSPGYYSISPYDSCTACPIGHQCSNPTVGPIQCPEGKYSDSLGAADCTPCPAGHSCSSPSSSPTICVNGYSELGNPNCTICPLNFDCSNSTEGPVPCGSGQYSAEGTLNCQDCPAGFECSSSPTPQSCPANSYSLVREMTCTVCPSGYACTSTNAPTICSPGTYSLQGESTCNACPAGHFCNVTTSGPTQCPFGYYTIAAGANTQCIACPAGSYCPDRSSATIITCAPGTYSTGGAGACTACPAGFNCPALDGSAILECSIGTYSTGGASECTVCPSGSFCSSTNLIPRICAPGTYSGERATNCTNCPAGYYCADPTNDPVPCPVGTFSTGSAISCGPCNGGYVCPVASIHASAGALCAAGSYCPPGASQSVLCPAGTFGNVTGQTQLKDACFPCPSGKVCQAGSTDVSASVFDCQTGYYCPVGTRFAEEFPCPRGFFNPNTGATQLQDCKACPQGHWCDEGSSDVTASCASGFYCPNGTASANANPCPAGTYDPSAGGLISSSQCVPCRAGYYCRQGSTQETPCPAGTYSNITNAVNAEICNPCPAGYACPATGNTDPHLSNCETGHYCPRGTGNANTYRCPGGTFTDRTNLTSAAECQICLQGYACEEGTGYGVINPVICQQGYFCPGAPTLDPPVYYSEVNTLSSYTISDTLSFDFNQYPCHKGTYGTSTGFTHADNCTVCPAGSFCVAGAPSISGTCAVGYYCPERSFQPKQEPCPSGTYSNVTGLAQSSDCITCPTGHFCRIHSANPSACPPGSYANTTNNIERGPTHDLAEKKCLYCPGGYHCPGATVDPLPCGQGKFSAPGSKECSVCEKGRYCPTISTSKETMDLSYKCPAGKYCPEGLTTDPTGLSQYDCPVSNYCPEGTRFPIRSPVGRYSNVTGLKSISETVICPPGYYCLEGTKDPLYKCEPGFYCPAGSSGSKQHPCPGGRYSAKNGTISSSDCVICPSGNYCPPGTFSPVNCPLGHYCPCESSLPSPCPIGTFGNMTNASNLTQCVQCLSGSYCDGVGESYPTGLCDPGYFCKGGAYTSQPTDGDTGGLCPRGFYCTQGTKVPFNCNPGTFNNFTGRDGPEDCIACTPGFYCSGESNSGPTGPCLAGYFCNGSSTSSQQYIVPRGHYSTEGASSPTPCAEGFYQPLEGRSTCLPCPAGFYCPVEGLTSATSCPRGHYCDQQSRSPTPCNSGTYGTKTNLNSSSQCTPCDLGYYCGSTGLTEPTGQCSAGFFCVGGASNPNPTSEATGGDICPVGHYCINGTKIECPAGTYNPSKQGSSIDFCLPCKPGRYCGSSGLSVVDSFQCDPGYYCVKGAIVPTPLDGIAGNLCPNGSHCPAGSTINIPCPEGSYQNFQGQSVCKTCPEKYFCPSSTGTVTPSICPTGKYCPAGTTSITPNCPKGTYNPYEGLGLESDCVPCLAGKFCSVGGLTAPDGTCAEGFYCLAGAFSETGQVISVGTGGECPAGHYCPSNSSLPTPCPIGTYSISTRATNVTSCLICPPGKFCNKSGVDKPGDDCDPGYYCISGATSSRPTDGNTGDKCPPGKFCKSGVSDPVPCAEGEYQDVPAQSSCKVCPERYFCDQTITGTINPTICPAGKYCSNGTGVFPTPCPIGTYLNTTGASSYSSCLKCSAGRFCSVTGLKAPDGVCSPGYYCTAGATDAIGTLNPLVDGSTGACTPGHYCPEGSIAEIRCPQGTYSPSIKNTNITACLPCTPGKYCEQTGLAAPTGNCSSGFYCPAGSSTATTTACTQGHYCPTGSIIPIPCPAGSFASVTGKASCDSCPSGNYCPPGAITPTECPRGKYCPAGTTNTIPSCPPGSFSNLTGLVAQSGCQLCSGGHFCEVAGLTAPTGKIQAGYYCNAGAINSQGTSGILGGQGAPGVNLECQSGSYCPQGSSNPLPCPAGTFGPNNGSTSLTNCLTCTAGKFCQSQNLDAPEGDCPAGYFCPAGTVNKFASLCTKGHSCPVGSPNPQPCPDGQYQQNIGSSTCEICPAGFYCSSAAITPVICPATSYCPEGTGSPIICPSGTFNLTEGSRNSNSCAICPKGKYCHTGVIQGDCAAGSFCIQSNSVPNPQFNPQNEKGGLCKAGYYCPAGTTEQIVCPDGTFSNIVGGADVTVCGPCLAGYFCRNGTIMQECHQGYYCLAGEDPVMCRNGTFNPNKKGESERACIACTQGYYCPFEGQVEAKLECPTGHFCPNASVSPQRCPIGTYRDTVRAVSVDDCATCPPGYRCPEASISPIPCLQATYCPAGSLIERTCPAGSYCPGTTGVPLVCPSGSYCPTGSFQPTQCPVAHYCPSGSISPSLCELGYKRRIEVLGGRTLNESCEICPAGTYGNHPERIECSPCNQGYYCTGGATDPETKFRTSTGEQLSRNVFPCPAGYFCGQETSLPTPCPKGQYQVNTGSSSCVLCPKNSFNNAIGQAKCLPCGPSSHSLEGAETCICNGTGRSYQPSDQMCICEPGQIFYDQNFNIVKDTDGTEPCQRFVYDRCNAGEANLRDIVGNCASSTDCEPTCRPFGGSGTLDENTRVCECTEITDVNEVCDSECRQNELKMKYNFRSNEIQITNPTTGAVEGSFPISKVSSGLADCVNEGGCDLLPVQMTNDGFLGVYNAEYSYFNNLFNRTQFSTIDVSNNKKFVQQVAEYVPQTGLLQPIVCLEYGGGLIFDISHSSRSFYPQYLKDALLNTEKNFDFGPFRRLDGIMRSNLTATTFVYMFQKSGVFVFQDKSDVNKILIVRVQNETTTCLEQKSFRSMTKGNLVALGIGDNKILLQAPDWILVMILLVFFLIFIALLIATIHFFRTVKWGASSRNTAKFRKAISINQVESKGLGFPSRRELFTTDKGIEEVINDDEDVVDLEGFNISMFYNKLDEERENMGSNMNLFKEEFMNKYNQILSETNTIKEMLQNTNTRVDLTVDVNNFKNEIVKKESLNRDQNAEKILASLKTQVQKLMNDQANKPPLDPKKTNLDAKSFQKLYNLNMDEDKHRSDAIKSYNILISQLEDIWADIEAADGDKGVDPLYNSFDNKLNSTSLVIFKTLENMNNTLKDKETLQNQDNPSNNKINLDSDMAEALKEFLSVQIKTLFDKYGRFGEDKEIGDNEEKEEDEENLDDKKEKQEEEDEEEEEESDLSEPSSDDEKDSESVKLLKKFKRTKIQLRHRQRSDFDDLDEEIDKEYKEQAEKLQQLFDKHTSKSINEMKERFRERTSKSNLSTDEKRKIVDKNLEDMKNLKNQMEDEKNTQLDNLKELLKDRKKKRLGIIKKTHKQEKEDLNKNYEADKIQLENIMEKIDKNKEKYGTGIQAEMEMQKELLKQKLELRKNRRERKQKTTKLLLDSQLDKEDTVDKEAYNKLSDNINKKLISLSKKQYQDELDSSNDNKKQTLMNQFKEDLAKYKQELDQRKLKDLEDLEEKIKKRRDIKNQQLSQLQTYQEQEDIKEQEKDYDGLKKIMDKYMDEHATSDGKADLEKRRQADLLEDKLKQLKKKHEGTNKQFIEKEKAMMKELDDNSKDSKINLEKEIKEKIELKTQEFKNALDDRLKNVSSKEEKDMLIKQCRSDIKDYTNEMNKLKDTQMSIIERKLAAKRAKKMNELKKEKHSEIMDHLREQEKELNKAISLNQNKTQEIKENINLSKKDLDLEKKLLDKHKNQLNNFKKLLENNHEKELENLKNVIEKKQIESKTLIKDQIALEKQRIIVKMKEDIIGKKDAEKEKILSSYKNEMNLLQNKELDETSRQEEEFKKRLLASKQKVKLRQKLQLDAKKRELESQADQLHKKNIMKSEEKLIKDLITDDKTQVQSIQDAIDRVLNKRHREEVESMNKKHIRERKTSQEENIDQRILKERVSLKEEQINEKKLLLIKFKEYEDLLKSRNVHQKEYEDQLKLFKSQIEKQKDENLKKMEEQKIELKAKMNEGLEKMKREIEMEKEKMQKMIADEKNKVSVQKELASQEQEVQKLIEQQKHLEKDEREALLAKHKINMQNFESALEEERKRQEQILKERIEQKFDDKLKEKEKQTVKEIDENVNKKIIATKNKQNIKQITTALKKAKATASLINLIDERGAKRVNNQTSSVIGKVEIKSTKKELKINKENAWLNTIYQKLVNIEALLLAEKRPYIDVNDRNGKANGVLVQVNESELNDLQLVHFQFAQFIVKLMKSKFAFIPDINLMVAKTLPNDTKYDHNAFKNSYFYDKTQRKLFIRQDRLSNIGKLVIIITHFLAHISINDMTNDEHPKFTNYFYVFLEVLAEDVFHSRSTNLGNIIISKENRENIIKNIKNMKEAKGSSKPSGIPLRVAGGSKRTINRRLKRQPTRSMINRIGLGMGGASTSSTENVVNTRTTNITRNVVKSSNVKRNLNSLEQRKKYTILKMKRIEKEKGTNDPEYTKLVQELSVLNKQITFLNKKINESS